MKTRRSWRNQNRLWRAIGNDLAHEAAQSRENATMEPDIRTNEYNRRLLDHECLYVHSDLGRLVKVTAIFHDLARANRYMTDHADQAVIAEIAGTIFLARRDDNGVQVQ